MQDHGYPSHVFLSRTKHYMRSTVPDLTITGLHADCTLAVQLLRAFCQRAGPTTCPCCTTLPWQTSTSRAAPFLLPGRATAPSWSCRR